MNPYLDSQNNPSIKIKVLLSSWKSVHCLIDTGFSGGLALPENLLANFKQKPIAYQEYELADGSLVNFSIYKTKIKYKQTQKEITLFFTKSNEGLAGIEFLTGFKLTLDLKRSSITLEQSI